MDEMLNRTYLEAATFGSLAVSGGMHVSYSGTYLTDVQVKELCRQYLDILEAYKEYYGEDWYNHNSGNQLYEWRLLSELYFVLGEYDLSSEIRNQLYEVTQNGYFGRKKVVNDGKREYEYDEYGRLISDKSASYSDGDGYDIVFEVAYEYGEYNKVVKITGESTTELTSGTYHSLHSSTGEVVFEYDSEGRPLEIRGLSHGWYNDNAYGDNDYEETIENTYSYIYNEGGVTIKYRREEWDSRYANNEIYGWSQDYEIDRYGLADAVGERYDEYRQEHSN